MGFNLGASNNSGKLRMTGFLGSSTSEERDIPIEQLVPWENQPFKMYDDFKLNELAESIKENGLLSRIIVYPINDKSFRIIAGHNRVEACRIAGMSSIPSIVKSDIDDNRAKLIMVDTNLCQRMEFLPSERAFAYKTQQDALIALGSSRTTRDIADKYGESKRTIQRYIACTRLIPELMDLLDEGKITLVVGERLSGLPNASQKAVAEFLSSSDNKISEDGAKALAERQLFSENEILGIINGKAEHKEPKTEIATDEPNEVSCEDDFIDDAEENDLSQTFPETSNVLEQEIERDEPVAVVAEDENAEKGNTAINDIVISPETARKSIGEKYQKKFANSDDIKQFIMYCLGRSDWLKEWVDAMRS